MRRLIPAPGATNLVWSQIAFAAVVLLVFASLAANAWGPLSTTTRRAAPGEARDQGTLAEVEALLAVCDVRGAVSESLSVRTDGSKQELIRLGFAIEPARRFDGVCSGAGLPPGPPGQAGLPEVVAALQAQGLRVTQVTLGAVRGCGSEEPAAVIKVTTGYGAAESLMASVLPDRAAAGRVAAQCGGVRGGNVVVLIQGRSVGATFFATVAQAMATLEAS